MNIDKVKKYIGILNDMGFSKTLIADLLGTGRSLIQRRVNSDQFKSIGKKNGILLSKLTELAAQYIRNNGGAIRKLKYDERTKIISGYKFFKETIVQEKLDKYSYEKVSSELKKKYPYCQLCGRTGVSLDTHHIVYRSEAPRHTMLHSPKNLIVTCRDCHEAMHKEKSIRDALYYSRNLHIIFKRNDRMNQD